MPWCDVCDRFLSPSTVKVDGTCPSCGRVVDPATPTPRRLRRRPTTRTSRRSRGTYGCSRPRWPSTSATGPCRASSGSSATDPPGYGPRARPEPRGRPPSTLPSAAQAVYGLWRSLVSALVWGTKGPGFKSRQPDCRKCRSAARKCTTVVHNRARYTPTTHASRHTSPARRVAQLRDRSGGGAAPSASGGTAV